MRWTYKGIFPHFLHLLSNRVKRYVKRSSLWVIFAPNELKIVIFEFILRRYHRIDDNLHHFMNHSGQKLIDKLIRNSKVWISIHFDQPCSIVLIYQKVIPEDFKWIFSTCRVKLCTYHCIYDQVFHSRHNVLFHTYPGVDFIKISLKNFKT